MDDPIKAGHTGAKKRKLPQASGEQAILPFVIQVDARCGVDASQDPH